MQSGPGGLTFIVSRRFYHFDERGFTECYDAQEDFTRLLLFIWANGELRQVEHFL
jgi:hypothetical protein